jgi:hypothetical protein
VGGSCRRLNRLRNEVGGSCRSLNRLRVVKWAEVAVAETASSEVGGSFRSLDCGMKWVYVVVA